MSTSSSTDPWDPVPERDSGQKAEVLSLFRKYLEPISEDKNEIERIEIDTELGISVVVESTESGEWYVFTQKRPSAPDEKSSLKQSHAIEEETTEEKLNQLTQLDSGENKEEGVFDDFEPIETEAPTNITEEHDSAL